MKAVWLMLVLGLLGVIPAVADEDEEEFTQEDLEELIRAPLVGLAGVNVFEAHVDSELVAAGLSRSVLRSEVEAVIARGGIPILTEQEWLEAPTGAAYLRIRVVAWEDEENSSYVYAAWLQLKEKVALLRDPMIQCYAETWSSGWFDSVDETELREIREAVRDLAADFVADYQAANPKE
jgi:hypothetical protein